MKIKQFFNRLIIILFFIILFIGNIFFYKSYRTGINDKIKDLENSIFIISQELSDFINNEKIILKRLDNSDFQNIKKLVKNIYLLNGENLRYAYFTDIKGNIYIYPEIKIQADFDPMEKEWYINAIKNENVVITKSYADIEKTELVITLSKVIKNNDKVLGVIGIDLNNKKLIKILDSVILKDLDAYFIIKGNGEILFSREVNEHTEYRDDKDVIQKIKFDKNFDLIREDDDIYAYHKIENDTYLLYIFDISTLKIEFLEKLFVYIIMVFIFLFLLKYIYGKFLIKNIIIPIHEISDSMNNFSLDLKNKKVPTFSQKYKIKEISDISESYEKLIGSSIASMLNFKLLTDEIKTMYNKLKKINSIFYEIIELITLLDKDDLTTEKYFESILKYAINHIEEAKYGSISIFENGKLEYISAIGHDIKTLRNLNIESKLNFDDYNDIVRSVTFEKIFDHDKEILNKEEYIKLKKATKPYKYALIYSTKIDEASLIISLDTPNEKGFSKESKELFSAYVKLAKLFLYKKFEVTRIENIYFSFAEKLASIAEGHDDITGKHIYRVGEISAFLAEKMGYDENFVEKIRKFAPLHDIGKIYVPYEILNKEGKLTKEEFEIMKKHTLHAKELFADDKYFNMALNISLYHHENCDGSGYPYGLKCEQIPIEAVIVKIADIYDALRAKRPYKESLSHEKCVEIIIKGDNRTNPAHFHKEVLKVFKTYHEEINKIWNEINISGGENGGIKN